MEIKYIYRNNCALRPRRASAAEDLSFPYLDDSDCDRDWQQNLINRFVNHASLQMPTESVYNFIYFY